MKREFFSLQKWAEQNGEYGTHILSEFTGVTSDGTVFSPSSVSFGSSKKLMWKCKNNHTWFSSCNKRTNRRNQYCPVCGKTQKSLQAWSLTKGEEGQRILSEFTGLREDGITIPADFVSSTSQTKYHWQCKKGHSWIASCYERTHSVHSYCPMCGFDYQERSFLAWCKKHGDYGDYLLQEFTGEMENGKTLLAENLPARSQKKCRWSCQKGHSWISSCKERTAMKGGCPICGGRQFSLKDWCSSYPENGDQVLQEFTGLSEKGGQYRPQDVFCYSSEKFLWKCRNGHSWTASCCARTKRDSSCPYCPKDNVKTLQWWCMENGDLGQQLIAEFTGEDENGNILPISEIPFASKTKYKWICSQQHTWFATISNRTLGMTRCPYCTNRKTTESNSFSHWCMQNGDFGKQLMYEFTGEKADGTTIHPDDVTFRNSFAVKWKCENHHEWIATIASRTTSRRICPECRKNRNSLKTWCLQNGDYGEKILHELTDKSIAETISYGSQAVCTWKCDKGHIWHSPVCQRTSPTMKYGCPLCSGKQVSENNSLLSWCQKYPQYGKTLLTEFTGETETNEIISADKISFASTKKLKWKCKNGHTWISSVGNRTGASHTNCPLCRNRISISLKEWMLTHDTGQILLAEFTGEREDGKRFLPEQIAFGSCKKYKWKCQQGHEFFQSCNTRTSAKNPKCPVCRKNKREQK